MSQKLSGKGARKNVLARLKGWSEIKDRDSVQDPRGDAPAP
jgi:hypothetical protein